MESVFRLFSDPPSEYRPAPFWVWNELMTIEKVQRQLQDLKDKGFGGAFVHARPGLITPYLSEEWLFLFKEAVKLGRELGLKIWIYDENSYPSGFAGGLVPAAFPGVARSGLRGKKLNKPDLNQVSNLVCVLQEEGGRFVDLTERVKAGEKSWPEGQYWVFEVVSQEPSPWHAGFTYVDLMRPGVTQSFLRLTLDAYKRVVGEEFGSTVPGSFQDEAEIAPAGGRWSVNYTPALFSEFRARRGYELKTELPSLLEEKGDFRKVRHDFYLTCLELFIENWAKPYYGYCAENRLQLTGHYWEHEWPFPRVNPDNMALNAYAHMPGIDILMNEWSLQPQAQFGNSRAVRELRSVANQLGRLRTLSETYGASGWDLTFFEQKRIADWEYALGVNFMNQHLVFSTIAGARKRDHPPSFSSHQPWWPAYRMMNDYFGRLSVALSAGEQLNRILVIEPTTTGWMYYSPAARSEGLEKIGRPFQNFVHSLERLQVEYDLGSEYVIREYGKVDGRRFIVGQRSYDLVVIPPGTENLESWTANLLKKFLKKGGKVFSWGEERLYVSGRPSLLADELKSFSGFKLMNGAEPDVQIFSPYLKKEIEFRDMSGEGMLFHQRRQLKDGQLLFLANISSECPASGQVGLRGKSVVKWEALSGDRKSCPGKIKSEKVWIDFSLQPGESVLLAVYRAKKEEGRTQLENISAKRQTVKLSPAAIKRLDPNVLTIDFCDLTLGAKREKDLYFYQAQQKTYQHHGWDKNPWDGAVQYQDSIISRNRFSSGTGYQADFHFQVAPGVDLKSMKLVVERPEIFQVRLNSQKLEPSADAFWLDGNFGVYSLEKAVRTGLNIVSLIVQPFDLLAELEPVYLLGNFSVEPAARGFLVTPAKELKVGSWRTQGLPFYGQRVAYVFPLEVTGKEKNSQNFFLKTGSWRGALAEVLINESPAGYLLSPYDELEISSQLKEGRNEITLIIYGTLKNTLGPHHLNPPPGRAWPVSFQQAPPGGQPAGNEYNFLDYGLEDVIIIEKSKNKN